MRRVITAAALCLVLATPAWADFDEGVAAFQRGDYAAPVQASREGV